MKTWKVIEVENKNVIARVIYKPKTRKKDIINAIYELLIEVNE